MEMGASLTLRCRGYDPTGLTKCEEKYDIASRPPSAPLDSPYVGTWFSCANEEVVVSTDSKPEASVRATLPLTLLVSRIRRREFLVRFSLHY